MKWMFTSLWIFLISFAYGAIRELPLQNVFFTGRSAELQWIQKTFSKTNHLVLSAGPGFGKTELAKQYAHLHSKNYDFVWWIEANQDLTLQLEHIVTCINKTLPDTKKIRFKGMSPETMMVHLKKALYPQRALYIFDNAEKFDWLIPLTGYAHCLFTTRNRISTYPTLYLKQLKNKDAVCLLKRLNIRLNDQLLIQLSQACAYHPLALITAAAFLKNHPSVFVSDYIRDLADKPYTRQGLPHQNIHTVLSLMLKNLEKENPDAANLLKFFSFLSPQQIPFFFVTSFLNNRKSLQNPHSVLSVLYQQSLVEVQQRPLIRIAMHDLIHQLLNHQVSKEEAYDLLSQALPMVSKPFEDRSDLACETVFQHPEYLRHAQHLQEKAKEHGFFSSELLILKIRMLNVLVCGLRDFERGSALLKDIQQDLVKKGRLKDLPPAVQALFAGDQGFISAVHSHYEEACEHNQRALDFYATLPNQASETLRVLANMAQSKVLLGDLEQGQTFIEKGEKLLKDALSGCYQALFLFSKLLLLSNQGKLDEVIKLTHQAEGRFQDIRNYPTLEIYLILERAEAYAKQGKQDNCTKDLEHADQKIEAFFGDRPTTVKANQICIQALNSIHQKPSKPLIEALQRSIEIYEKNQMDRAQAFALDILARVYTKAHRWKQALDAALQSERIYLKLLKSKAIHDVSRLYSLLVEICIALKDVKTAMLYTQEHTKIFGSDHPQTRDLIQKMDQITL
ncbi:MAG: hypothetical protein ACRCYP_04560 [Alphaproteobacteria bacterium]